ncbi:DUF202 domain-containing protein [Saccharomonospora glauca]|jgi:uncharacterized membrane protein YidH (DUF202 family)|uniref:DUF202 domain-containing protein n=1 Tax=Saccharomonospora glauca K62 TaxID=928724 RepID=I1D061_9PSEU|nr:DUF202 domain-containing protein [Saccharomonospora glauca]EIE98335.1 hypothetical protein SacglDRAFT_01412 [Saccharomonospora glauca K62]
MSGEPERGLPSERTGLAWQRSALGAGAVSLLLLYHTARTGWSSLTAAAACTALTTVVLTVAGVKRDRDLRRVTPPAPPRTALAAVAFLVTAAAVLALVALPW